MGIEDRTTDDARGLDRRTLIKRAAAAGALAWTAPVLINSMDSPAAAGTCACDGCFYVEIQPGVCGDSNNQYHFFQIPDHTCQPNYGSVNGCSDCFVASGQPLSEFCIEPADQTILCKEDEEQITLQIISSCTTGPGTEKNPIPVFGNCKFVSGAGQAEDGVVSCVTDTTVGVTIPPGGQSITFDRLETIDPTENRWTEFRVILCCESVPA